MHDRGANLTAWREQLRAQDTLSAQEIAELEAHLLDQVSGLVATGLSDKEAWMIAEHRLGNAETLAEEYRRGDPNRVSRNHLVWMLIGILAFIGSRCLLGIGELLSVMYVVLFDVNYLSSIAHALILYCVPCAVVYMAYRVWFKGRGEVWSQRAMSFARRPGALLVGMLGVWLLGYLLHMGSALLLARFLLPEAVSTLMTTTSYASLVWWPVVIIVLVLILHKLRLSSELTAG